jgi:uncharacterized protein
MPRLAQALAEVRGEIHAELAFAPSHGSRGRVMGRITGVVPLTCQRCLQAFDWAMNAPFDWQLVRDEVEEERLMAEADPVQLVEGWLLLTEAVEDEALLALPIAPLCADAGCAQRALALETAAGGAKPDEIGHNVRLDEQKPNPFTVLKGQFPAKKPGN